MAIVSCVDDAQPFERQQTIWHALDAEAPDFIFSIGDNVYADHVGASAPVAAKPPRLWERYVQTRQLVPLYRFPHLVPVFAIWDDHDYGVNDGDSSYPYREDSLATFRAFWAQPQTMKSVEFGPGAAFAWSAFGQKFAFLDGRYYRSPNRRPAVCEKQPAHSACKKGSPSTLDSDQETALGWGQESWLAKFVAQTKAPVWLIKGDQFFGGYHPFESFEGSHPYAFSRFKAMLREAATQAIFLSGDRHLSEVMAIPENEIGVATYEITSSPIHSRVYPPAWDTFPNPRQIANVTETYNFVTIDVRKGSRPTDIYLRVRAIDERGLTVFSKQLLFTSARR